MSVRPTDATRARSHHALRAPPPRRRDERSVCFCSRRLWRLSKGAPMTDERRATRSIRAFVDGAAAAPTSTPASAPSTRSSPGLSMAVPRARAAASSAAHRRPARARQQPRPEHATPIWRRGRGQRARRGARHHRAGGAARDAGGASPKQRRAGRLPLRHPPARRRRDGVLRPLSCKRSNKKRSPAGLLSCDGPTGPPMYQGQAESRPPAVSAAMICRSPLVPFVSSTPVVFLVWAQP